MLTLTTDQQEAVQGPITAPQYLVDIELGAPFHWSTREERIEGGVTYQPGRIRSVSISPRGCTLVVDNHDYVFTNGAIDGAFLRAPVTVWWAYGARPGALYAEEGYWESGYTSGPGTQPAVIQRFSGIVDATPEIGEWMTVECTWSPPRRYPFRRLRPPIANWLPSPGYVVEFDGGILRIDS